MDRPSSALWLRGFVVVVVLSFVGATGFGQWQSASIDRAASRIADHIAPSIERLAAARVEIRNVRVLLEEDLEAREADNPGIDSDVLDRAIRGMDAAFEDPIVRPTDGNEAERFRAILAAKANLDHEITLFRADTRRGDLASAHGKLRDVALASSDLHAAITRDIELDAEYAQRLAVEIRRLRERNMMLAFGLDVLSTAIAIAGAVFLLRVLRSRAKLAERHEQLREERVAELEQFAGRVAHDILSPLGAVAFALRLAQKENDPVQRSRFGDRGWAAIERVKLLVSGLLDFARAGAKSDPDARVSVNETVTEVVTELETEATEAGADLVVERGRDLDAACNPGVLTSLVSNLARNAIKYIGDGREKRIAIRWHDREDIVHVDVEDTGPGLPIDIEARVFEPYTRARGTNRPGIGLGLATVKRLAEAHGGRVGVRSVPGEGCTFWFELPIAELAKDARSSGTVHRLEEAASA